MGELISIKRRKRAGPRWRMPCPGYHYLEIRDRSVVSGWRIVGVVTRGADGWWWWWISADRSVVNGRAEQAGRTLATLYEIKSIVREGIE